METKVSSYCLRYMIPFVLKEDFESACEKTDSFHVSITPRYANKEKEELYRWERIVMDEVDGVNAVQQSESDLYDYIRKEFSMSGTVEDENKMGCTWKLSLENTDSNGKKEFPYRLLWVEESIKKASEAMPNYHEFSFKEIGLFLFRNGLGFFWYEIEMKKNPIQVEKLIEFQNAFRELNRCNNIWIHTSRNSPVYLEFNENGTTLSNEESILKRRYITPFSVGSWVSELLGKFLDIEYISPRKNAFKSIVKMQLKKNGDYMMSSSNWKECLEKEQIPGTVPDKAILFTYAAFTPQKYGPECMISDEKRDIVYHLTNGYKESYHYSPEINNKMIQPFADVLWYATKEGTSYIVWPSEHSSEEKMDGNAGFFDGNFISKIEGDYFHLFVRCLYQSYSLLLFAEQTQRKLSALKCMYMEEEESDSAIKEKKEKNKNELENLCIDINLFLTKNMATSVSHIHHQSDFYIYLMDCLHIHSDIESVTAGLNALDTLQREQKEKEEHRREKAEDEQEAKRDNRFQAIMGLLSILTISSALVDWRTLAEPIISTELFDNWVKAIFPVIDNVHFYQVSYLAIVSLGMIGLLVTVSSFVKSFRHKKKK